MKRLMNPRGYLSHTQIDMWLRSKDRYMRNYFFGEEEKGNSAMALGSKVALAQETGEETDDELVNTLVSLLPRYPKHEHEIRADLNTKDGVVTLLGKLDQFHDVTLAFRDTKTGRVAWTQKRAESSRQIQHYSALIYLKHGKLPPEAFIDWAETDWEDGVLTLTGKIETFRVKPTLSGVLAHLATAARVAKEIDAAYRKEMHV